MTAPPAAPLRRWAIRWTQPNGATDLGDGYDDHEHAVENLRAARELVASTPHQYRMRYALEDRHAGVVSLALTTKHDAATCPACSGDAR